MSVSSAKKTSSVCYLHILLWWFRASAYKDRFIQADYEPQIVKNGLAAGFEYIKCRQESNRYCWICIVPESDPLIVLSIT